MCLTRAEAIAAADSALYGQSTARSFRMYKALAAVKSEEAGQLREAYRLCDSTRTAGQADLSRMSSDFNYERTQRIEYQDKSKRRGRTVVVAVIVAVLSTAIHFTR